MRKHCTTLSSFGTYLFGEKKVKACCKDKSVSPFSGIAVAIIFIAHTVQFARILLLMMVLVILVFTDDTKFK